ncbi:MAG: succinate dehydrogenase, hydrophobic membrane anchor protein [Stellaceae bacterium]
MRSPLGRVLGLGSAKEGVEHWWLQRLTAVALVPLVLWFAAGIVRLAGADLAAVRDWAGHPLPATLLVLLLAATFYHAALGLQVVIEDYIHAALTRIGLVMAVRLVCAAFAAAGIIAVLGMAFGAAH